MEIEVFSWTPWVSSFHKYFPVYVSEFPWYLTSNTPEIIAQLFPSLSADYNVHDGVAIHASAVIERNVTLKGPIIIGPNCFVAANCYLRGGVYLISHNSIGPGCEIKSSIIFPNSNLAHFNFVGDSVLGSNVNFEAGAIIANHFNERVNKEISVVLNGKQVITGIEKFGALVGDSSKIGSNAVLSPGTLLHPNCVVKRLELIDQQE